MYHILIKLIVAVSLLQLGINLTDSGECSSRECVARIERASHNVLRIEWRPISVFPKEAKRFR